MDARIQKNMHENNVVIGGGDLFSDALKSAHNSSPAFNLTKSVHHNFDDSNSNANNNGNNYYTQNTRNSKMLIVSERDTSGQNSSSTYENGGMSQSA